jgi:hypothetical protein
VVVVEVDEVVDVVDNVVVVVDVVVVVVDVDALTWNDTGRYRSIASS